jgi:hypothetical protein
MRHNSSHFQILSACKNGYIGVCDCCQQFNFSYNNVLLLFSEEEMMNFFDWLMAYRHSRENFVSLPDGRDRIYSSPHSNLFLVYSDTELEELSDLFAEVKIMLEVRKIMS